MGLFKAIMDAPAAQFAHPATSERLARRQLVLDTLRNAVACWAGEELTIDEAIWLLSFVPELTADEFMTMRPMGEA
jgi:hypothetical protein